jgi:hypothetical protein
MIPSLQGYANDKANNFFSHLCQLTNLNSKVHMLARGVITYSILYLYDAFLRD